MRDPLSIRTDDIGCEGTYTENISKVTFAGKRLFPLKIISRVLAP